MSAAFGPLYLVCLARQLPPKSLGGKEPFKGHLVQPPCHVQGHQLEQVPQSPVEPGLEHFQELGFGSGQD